MALADTGMSSPQVEYPAVIKDTGDFPERHRAGHFEHVAHMKVFDTKSPKFRIPAKICFVKMVTEDADSSVNFFIFDSGLGDRKINVSGPAHTSSEEKDDCSKLLRQVKVDLHLGDSEDNSGPETSPGHSASFKKRTKSRRKKEEKPKELRPRMRPGDDGEDAEWVKAKGKVEAFLDFPGAMAFRNRTEADRSSQITPDEVTGQEPRSNPAAVPNSRHNAIFLRCHEQAAQDLQLNPNYHEDKRPPNSSLNSSAKH